MEAYCNWSRDCMALNRRARSGTERLTTYSPALSVLPSSMPTRAFISDVTARSLLLLSYMSTICSLPIIGPKEWIVYDQDCHLSFQLLFLASLGYSLVPILQEI